MFNSTIFPPELLQVMATGLAKCDESELYGIVGKNFSDADVIPVAQQT